MHVKLLQDGKTSAFQAITDAPPKPLHNRASDIITQAGDGNHALDRETVERYIAQWYADELPDIQHPNSRSGNIEFS